MPGTVPESPGTEMACAGCWDRKTGRNTRPAKEFRFLPTPPAPMPQACSLPPVSFPTPQPDLPAPRLWVSPSAQKLGSAVLPKLPRDWI